MSPHVLLIGAAWPARALVRAQLLEAGFEVLALDAWPPPRGQFSGRAKPRAAVVDLQGLAEPRRVLDELRLLLGAHHVVILTALATLSPEALRRDGFRVLPRPVSVQDIVSAVAAVLRTERHNMPFTIMSSAFKDGTTIPKQFTCDGGDTEPPLEVSNAPEGTRSFALIMDDRDAPKGTFTHWLVYDIAIEGGNALAVASGKTLPNDFGRAGYGGPCPPPGHGPHRYTFTVYAVAVPSLGVQGTTRLDLEEALQTHTLASTKLVGTYERRR